MFKKLLTSSLLTLVAVGGFFGLSVHHTINNDGKVTLIAEVGGNISYAKCADGGPGPCPPDISESTQNAEIQKMLNTLVAGINIVLSILTIIVSPAIMLASWLMSPDWTSGDLFGIRPVMHSLWITVSNIAYFIYAILLIFIALATIFNSEHYGYKSMLPKLALGIMMVPLTWLAVQYTVSLATYVTAAAVSVPAEALKTYTTDSSWWNTAFIPREMIYKNNGNTEGSDGTQLSGKASIDSYCNTTNGGKGDDTKCISPSKITENAGGLFSPLLIYSYGVFKIQDVKELTTKADLVKTILSIINQGIIGALMFLVFGILVLALIFMLLMRAIKLWFYAIFSPLFTIKFVLGEKAFGDADKDGSFNISEFIGLAFVPAVVSLALSFGLIIIAGLMSSSNIGNPDNKCEGTKCTITLMSNPANTIVSDVQDQVSTTKVTIGGVSYTFEGSVGGSNGIVPVASSALSATGNMFGTIIIDLIALIFIWIAFMAGKGVSKAAGKAIEPFENMGNQIGKLGMSLPKYAPIPGTGGLSVKSMERVPQSIETAIQTNDTKKFENSGLGKMLRADLNIPPEVAKRITDAIISGNREKLAEETHNAGPMLSRQNGHNSGIVEEFMKKVKEDHTYLDKLNLSPEQKHKFEEFKDKDLKNETTRKNVWDLWLNTLGGGKTGSGSNSTSNDSGYTMDQNKVVKDKILINLGGPTINVDQFDGKTPDQIATMISTGITNKAKDFQKKPVNIEDLRKMLDSYGLKGSDIVAKIEIEQNLQQKKADTKPEPKK